MTDLEMWTLIVGFISATFVLPIIQQPRWSNPKRAAVTFIYSVIVGYGTTYVTGGFAGIHDIRNGVSAMLLMLVTAIASYRGFAKPTGIAPTIEGATSPSPQVQAADDDGDTYARGGGSY